MAPVNVQTAVTPVGFKGPHDTDASMFREAAGRLRGGYMLGGGNLTEAVAALLVSTADGLDARLITTPQQLAALPPMSLIYDGGERPGFPGFHLFRQVTGWITCGGVKFPDSGVVLPAVLLYSPEANPEDIR